MTGSAQRPHVIFIVADDLGYADLGCYGGRTARFGPVSPEIDAMARAGIRFTQGYSNSPVCSPTRFALMTGRYQYRLRGAAEEPIRSGDRGNPNCGLPPAHPTLPSLLRAAGYRTALVGKWHLGHPPHFGPLKSGYDHFFGPMAGGVDYFTHCDSKGQHDLWNDEALAPTPGYLTDLLTERALSFIEEAVCRPGQPFLLSLHYTAPHWPWETREDPHLGPALASNLFHLDGGSVETYQRMIRQMDEGIGRIRVLLRRLGLAQNTLVIFTSDNGGERYSDNWPLVGGKMDLTEGGIRVPWVAEWPACIPPSSLSKQPCITMDWTTTVLDAAGVAAAPDYPLDGQSLMQVLVDPGHRFERPLFWRMKHLAQRAFRDGPWKYLRVDGIDYLFDLSQDERERANLARRHPERLAAMRDAWETWEASMPPIPADASVSPVYSTADMPQR